MNKDTEYPIVDIDRLKAKGVDVSVAYVMFQLREKCSYDEPSIVHKHLYSKGIAFFTQELESCNTIEDIINKRKQWGSLIYTDKHTRLRNRIFREVEFDYSKSETIIKLDIIKNKKNNNFSIFERHICDLFGKEYFDLLFMEKLNKYTYLLDVKNQEKWFDDGVKYQVEPIEKDIKRKQENLLSFDSIPKDSLIKLFYGIAPKEYRIKELSYEQIRDYLRFERKKDLINAEIRLKNLLSQKFKPIDPWTLLDYPNLYHAPDFIETIRSPKTPPFVSQLESFEQRLLTLDF
jgi:hypothetical protein